MCSSDLSLQNLDDNVHVVRVREVRNVDAGAERVNSCRLMKKPDLTAADMEAAVKTIAGSARSMGITVEGV